MTHAELLDQFAADVDAAVLTFTDSDGEAEVDIHPAEILSAKFTLVDDESTSLAVAQRYLELEGYRHFSTTTDPTAALRLIRRDRPDVLLLDIMMPGLSGLDILRELRNDGSLDRLAVIVLTAATDSETKRQAFDLGVTDFLGKPIDQVELSLRVRSALTIKLHQDRLLDDAAQFEKQLDERRQELAASREELILCLARAGEFRDDETGNHVIRVGKYVSIMAQELGYSPEQVRNLEQAARLHDVGKIAIGDEILRKPARRPDSPDDLVHEAHAEQRQLLETMSPDEWLALQRHAELGARMLDVKSSPVLSQAALIALTHHERWDGSGYPIGLAGEAIPIEGRMTAVADVYDALSTMRPHKRALARKECFSLMQKERGRHFDPRVLDAFFRRREDIVRVQIEWADMN